MVEYKLLKALEKNPSASQRTLAEQLDVSLGKINYLLAGLVEKGLVKAQRLKNEPQNIRWHYIITPKGIKEKVRITKNYLDLRVQEYNELQNEIKELRREVTQAQ